MSFSLLLFCDEVCSYAMPVGTGAVVPGFPNGGVAFTYDAGYGFGWGDAAVIAAGQTYDLCWCNGTASDCTLEADFKAFRMPRGVFPST